MAFVSDMCMHDAKRDKTRQEGEGGRTVRGLSANACFRKRAAISFPRAIRVRRIDLVANSIAKVSHGDGIEPSQRTNEVHNAFFLFVLFFTQFIRAHDSQRELLV